MSGKIKKHFAKHNRQIKDLKVTKLSAGQSRGGKYSHKFSFVNKKSGLGHWGKVKKDGFISYV